MKNIVSIISIFWSINCLSQNPDPQLFQTWYLTSILPTDMTDLTVISQIEPPITPTLSIMDNFSFTGQGACNTFEGNFTSGEFFYSWETTELSMPSNDCGIEAHNSFESSYYYLLLSAAQYYIFSVPDGLILTMSNPLMGYAEFQNFQLSSKKFDLPEVAIYPNPTSSIFSLKVNGLSVSKIDVVNSIGQHVRAVTNNFQTVDISHLTAGIYILEIETEKGTIIKKIIKE